jgi:sugar/nucleoside kinase (ribokinase family)
MVWDRIHARDGRAHPIEEWGGISYALAAAAAARPDGWTVVPIIRVGRDLAESARLFFNELPGLDTEPGVCVVEEPNKRVELRYRDNDRRFERMSGGVGAWSWTELAPVLAGLDALYVNFISGFELELETAQRMRLAFDGPIYGDLHSMFLGIDPTGLRIPRNVDAWREWLRCFDIVQVNEEELGLLAQAWGDPWRFAAEAVSDELKLVIVTLGGRGAAYFASSAFTPEPMRWRERSLVARRQLVAPGPVRSELIPPDGGAVEGDPTGCGDVWGATCFNALLSGADLRAAARRANEASGRNVRHRGARGLFDHLLGRIGT